VSNIPTYAFAALQLSVAFATVLSAQSAARYELEQAQARREPSAVGLRLPSIAAGENLDPACGGCGFVAPLP
jgi:hypothetical protein